MENSSIEGFLIELNLKNKQWLVCCSYNQYPIYISDHLSSIRSNLDLFSGNHTNTFLMGDFNCDMVMLNLMIFATYTVSKALQRFQHIFTKRTFVVDPWHLNCRVSQRVGYQSNQKLLHQY